MGVIGKQIEKYLSLKKMPVSNFEAQIGISNGNIRKCIKQGTDIQSKWITAIITTFDDISPISLLTGEGDILLHRPAPRLLGDAAATYLSDKSSRLEHLQKIMDTLSNKMKQSTDADMPQLADEIIQIFEQLAADYSEQKEETVEIIDHHNKLKSIIKKHFNIK